MAISALLAWAVLARLPARLQFRSIPVAPSPAQIAAINAVGTGEDYFAIATGRQLILARIEEPEVLALWQYNSPRPIHLGRGVDLDGDGLEEITFHERSPAGSTATVLDARGTLIRTFGPIEVPGAPQNPEEQSLRGLAAMGDLRQGLVCLLTAPNCPGAVVNFGPSGGGPVWQHWMGSWPREVVTADLDGEAGLEVLVETGSTGSTRSLDGTDDQHAYAIALDGSGRRLWQQSLSGPMSRVQLTVLSPGPDGRSRVLATTASHHAKNPEPGTAVLMDGPTGEVLSRREFVGGLGGACVIPDGQPRVVVGSPRGRVRVLDLKLRPILERDLQVPVEVNGCVDLDSDGASEVIAATRDELLILDQRLRTRVRRPHPESDLGTSIRTARAGAGRWRLYYLSGTLQVLNVTPLPALRDPQRLAPALILVAASGFLPLLLPGRRRRPVRRAADAHDFLTEFVEIQHETFAGTSPFAALRQWDQAVAGGVLPLQTLDEAVSKFSSIGAPMIRRFAARAVSFGARKAQERRMLALVGEIEALLHEAQSLPASRRSPVVQQAVESIDALSRECEGCTATWPSLWARGPTSRRKRPFGPGRPHWPAPACASSSWWSRRRRPSCCSIETSCGRWSSS